jgi:peptidoglycan/xylan/chitin deacetylase (PgdA/CDA1 family)
LIIFDNINLMNHLTNLKRIKWLVSVALFSFIVGACSEEPTAIPPPLLPPTNIPVLALPTPTIGMFPLPSGQALSSNKFASCEFRQLWEYSDRLLGETGPSERSFVWGPNSFGAFEEPYLDAPGGKRLVQYFDKGRMEMEKGPTGNTVTGGLLTKELITGQIQLGNNAFENRAPSQLPVVGDTVSNNPAPTYVSLRKVISLVPGENAVPEKLNQTVTDALDGHGTVTPLSNPPAKITMVSYDPAWGHNVADVFQNYQNLSGRVWWNNNRYIHDKLFPAGLATQTLGLPLSEPYWIKTLLDHQEKEILVQVFERRVLTYTPSNPEPFKLEMNNLGQHYFQWRYNGTAANTGPPPFQGSCQDKDLATLPQVVAHEEIYMPSLMFHQIRNAPEDPFSNSQEFLVQVLDWLVTNNYNPVTVGQVADFLQNGNPLPPSPVILRFDDGWKSQLFAADEMQKRGMTATFFVMTDAPGPYLYGQDFVKLEKRGFEIGAHTRTHAMLTKIANPKLEIEGNKQDLGKLLGHPVRSFAYPYGLYNDKIQNLLKASRFDIGVTVDQGAVWHRNTMFTQPNITMEGLSTLDQFIRRLNTVR